MVPNFSFWSWFERMGYDRQGGEEECAEDLGITVEHVRRLCTGKRMPSQDLADDCRRLEEALVAEREREIQDYRTMTYSNKVGLFRK